MSNLKAEVTTDWADGTYTFRLTVKGTLELEEKCDAPFTVIFQRLIEGTYRLEDVRQTIRLGLIGGGMEAAKAFKLVERYIDEPGRVTEHLPFARLILGGLLFGFEAEPLGNQEAASEESTSDSTPPPSTETQPSSDSTLETSMNSRSGNTQPH